MNQDCNAPIPLDDLIGYHLGDLPEEKAEAIEEHYFACASCTSRLETVVRLGAGIVEVVRRGAVSASVTADLVARGIEKGLEVRSYHVAAGQQVACTVAPTDDFVAIRLGLDIERADAVDVAVQWTSLESQLTEERLIPDVSFDRSAGEVVLLFAGAQVREFPRSQWRMEAVVRDSGEESRLGPFTLNHTPWEQLGD